MYVLFEQDLILVAQDALEGFCFRATG